VPKQSAGNFLSSSFPSLNASLTGNQIENPMSLI